MTGTNHPPSTSEKKVFYALCLLKPTPIAQYPVGFYTIDIAFPSKKIAIEIDGQHHREQTQLIKDNDKDEYLKSKGWKVLRFTAEEAYNTPDDVALRIKEFMRYSGNVNKPALPAEKTKQPKDIYVPQNNPTITPKQKKKMEDKWEKEEEEDRKYFEERDNANKNSNWKIFVFSALLIILIIMVLFIFNNNNNQDNSYFDVNAFDTTAVNPNINLLVTESPEITAFCNQKCMEIGETLTGSHYFDATSSIACFCDGVDFGFDLRTRAPLSFTERLYRNNYYTKLHNEVLKQYENGTGIEFNKRCNTQCETDCRSVSTEKKIIRIIDNDCFCDCLDENKSYLYKYYKFGLISPNQ